MKKKYHPFLIILIILVCCGIGFFAFQLFSKTSDYRAGRKHYRAVAESYSPHDETEPKQTVDDPTPTETEGKDTGNPTIAQLCADYPDAIGWLTVPGTRIDYPFVCSKDNFDYLHADLDGNYLYAGTPFLDCHCSRDLSSQNSIIFGHNMYGDGSMFADLAKFKDEQFFNEHPQAFIYLPDRTLQLDIFAAVIVDAVHESQVYNREIKDDFMSYVQSKAMFFRETALLPEDRVVTISTCSYEFSEARLVLLCKVSP